MTNFKCQYPNCDCAISFPDGYKPSVATECPKSVTCFQYDDLINKTLYEQTRKQIVTHIHDLIEEQTIKKFPAEHRNHLGASVIGDNCSRRLWYSFRWCKLEQFEGRMRRLFDRGNQEEAKFIELLRSIGFTIWEVDPDTGKQFRIYGIEGHFGGSGDSKALMPWFPDMPILLEFKTHNTKSFCHLVANTLKLSKPQHYNQICIYSYKFKLKYCLYCAINKNDDDLYFELIEADWNLAQQLENKAYDIINSQIPLPKISEHSSYFDCKFCSFNGICHHNEEVDKNCRSCKFSKPIEEANWFCTKHNQIIPNNAISQSWSCHVSINI